MSIFATELAVKVGISKAQFVASVISWLRGIKRSTILQAYDAKESYDDETWLETADGETLALKTFEGGGVSVYGARLEIPDKYGRKWRTECVLTDFGHESFLLVRGQCVALNDQATVVVPKKPHFVRQAIEDGWCVSDGLLAPSLAPHPLSGGSLDIASKVILGGATNLLPMLYVSRGDSNHLPFDTNRAAKELAGVCHVVVEPSRSFSFDLMEKTGRRNPYGGAVALISPSGRHIFRALKRSDDQHGATLLQHCIHSANSYVSSRAALKGWEWQDLQVAQSRRLREIATTQRSDDLEAYIDTFDNELKAKQERIEKLEAQLEIAEANRSTETLITEDLFPFELKKRIGPELYDGEFTDRLRSFIESALKEPTTPRNRRTDEFISRLIENLHFSGRSQVLISQIKRACRDGNQMPRQLGQILSGFGYTKSSDGPHTKFEPPAELFGLQTEILPSTPSDSQRGGKNRSAEVIRSFGLNDLK